MRDLIAEMPTEEFSRQEMIDVWEGPITPEPAEEDYSPSYQEPGITMITATPGVTSTTPSYGVVNIGHDDFTSNDIDTLYNGGN